jgi:hypothetical protein
MCGDLDGEGFAKNAGIPMDMARLFANPRSARDWCRLVADFLATHEEVKILEELDDVLEKEIKAIAYDRGYKTRIIGKQNLEEWIGEYTPDKVLDVLAEVWSDLLPVKETGSKIEISGPACPSGSNVPRVWPS